MKLWKYWQGAWAAPGCFYTCSVYHSLMLHLDVSTPQGPWAAPRLVYTTLHRSLLHPYVSTVYTHWGLRCTWTVYITEACAPPGRVYTTEAWAAPGRVWTTGAFAASGCDYINYRDMSCTWTYLPTEEACAALGLVYTTEACAAPQRFYTLGPELHLNVFGQQEPLLHPYVSTPTGAWDALELSTLQKPVLLLDVSIPQSLSCTWTCLDNRSLCCCWMWLGKLQRHKLQLNLPSYTRCLCCSWTCLHYRGYNCTATFLHTGACASPRCVFSTGAELHLDFSTLQKSCLHNTHKDLSCTLTCLHTLQRTVLLLDRGLCCTTTFLHTGAWAEFGLVCVYTAAACAVPGLVYTMCCNWLLIVQA